MDHRLLGRTGVRVSPLCLGALNFGGGTAEADAVRMVHAALDAGINFVDTADVYNAGDSERIVGKALAGRRDKVVLATKVHGRTGLGPNDQGNSRLHLLRACEASLRRLGTDYIDLYEMRWLFFALSYLGWSIGGPALLILAQTALLAAAGLFVIAPSLPEAGTAAGAGGPAPTSVAAVMTLCLRSPRGGSGFAIAAASAASS